MITVALCVYALALSGHSFESSLAEFSGDQVLAVTGRLDTAVAVTQPIEYLAIGALAWSCLSAVRAAEEPGRFWRWVFGGSTTLAACLVAIFLASSAAVSVQESPSDPFYELVFIIGPMIVVAAEVVLLVAFARGLPPNAHEAADGW